MQEGDISCFRRTKGPVLLKCAFVRVMMELPEEEDFCFLSFVVTRVKILRIEFSWRFPQGFLNFKANLYTSS